MAVASGIRAERAVESLEVVDSCSPVGGQNLVPLTLLSESWVEDDITI